MTLIEEYLIYKLDEQFKPFKTNSIVAEKWFMQLFEKTPINALIHFIKIYNDRLSQEFLNEPLVWKVAERISPGLDKAVVYVFLLANRYLLNKSSENKENLERAMRLFSWCALPQNEKAEGRALLDSEYKTYLQKLLSYKDEDLNNICLKYFPSPSSGVFDENILPKSIKDQEAESTRIIIKLLDNKRLQVYKLEDVSKKLQRNFRAKKRQQEENNRLRNVLNRNNISDLLKDANSLYLPKCNTVLAQRIMEAVNKVQLFTTVKHLTTKKALESIFKVGILGRRTLLLFMIPFTPAALGPEDIRQGDANSICFGANLIDKQYCHEVELKFNAKKLAQKNSAAFFKERDLCFIKLHDQGKFSLGSRDYIMTHTEVDSDHIKLTLFDGQKRAEANVSVTSLISYNVEKMHQILTLNFFRFLDLIDNEEMKNTFYADLATLADKDLIDKLEEIGKLISDAMEFNIYGAYQIDFSTLTSITILNQQYTLVMADLLQELSKGKTDLIKIAHEKLPEIFNSYRFIAFLDFFAVKEAKTYLATLDAACEKPKWLPPTTRVSI